VHAGRRGRPGGAGAAGREGPTIHAIMLSDLSPSTKAVLLVACIGVLLMWFGRRRNRAVRAGGIALAAVLILLVLWMVLEPIGAAMSPGAP
jgi:Ca2+/Na+ antiporter